MRRARSLLVGIPLIVAGLAAPPAVLANDVYVNSLSDSSAAGDGACTLREAIVATNLNLANTNADCPDGTSADPDFIRFSVSGKITLTSPLPAISDPVEIDGNLAITVDGGDAFRPFTVTAGGLTLRELVVQNGNGGSGFGFGGAVSNGASTMIIDSVIRSSFAGYGGGIHNNGAMSIFSSTIEGNQAETAGGGIYNEGTLTVRNATIAGNKAPAGAGVFSADTATLAHATIARNTAPAGGGGGVNRNAGAMTIVNSIVAGNAGGQLVGTTASSSNVVRASADGVLDTALRDNGGSTPTIRLPAGSLALGVGVADWCSYVSYVDQRGLARPSSTGAHCDAGAVQRDRTAPVMTVAPRILLRDLASLSGTSIRAWLTSWSATDGSGIGIEHFSLQRQVNGGAWTTLVASIPPRPDIAAFPATGSVNILLAKDTRYRFRVRAVDQDSNVSAWAYSPTVTARLFQQTTSHFGFSTGWGSATSTKYSGGSVKYTAIPGKAVRMTFKGRAFALVTTLRTGQSFAVNVSVDGVPSGMNEVSSTVTRYRVQLWPASWSTSGTHTIRYAVAGESKNRIDVDAIAVLE